MAWDKSKPVTSSALNSAEIRANWDALDTQLLAPVVAAAPEQVLKVGAGDVLAGIPTGSNTHVLTLVGGVPTWAAPAAGGVTWPLLAPAGTAAAPSYSWATATGTGFYRVTGSGIALAAAGTPTLIFNYDDTTGWIKVSNTGAFGWSASASLTDVPDLVLSRLAPTVLALRGGGSAVGASLNLKAPTVPGTPPAGTGVLYPKADKKLYWKDDAGVETDLTLSVTYPLRAPDGSVAAPSYAFASDVDTGLDLAGPNILGVVAGGTYSALATSTAFAVVKLDVGLNNDTFLAPDGPGLLAQRNGTNAQTFRLYGTYTDASNYERLQLALGGVVDIASQAAGTGTVRGIRLYTDGAADLTFGTNATMRWFIAASDGSLFASTDNVYDLGYAAGTGFGRPRTLAIGTSINFAIPTVPGTPATGTGVLYMKTDKKLYFKNDAGVETALF
jgi:hypothetical protein